MGLPTDPIESVAYGLAKGATEAFLDVMASKGPAVAAGIVGGIRAAWANTIVNAPVNAAQDTNLENQVNDAIKNHEVGGPGAAQ